MTETTRLTDTDRHLIGRARELAALTGADAVRDHTGEAQISMAYACAYGEARARLGDLLAIIGRLSGEEPGGA